MLSKKKRKSSCPFASANQADVLATIVIKSKIDGRTIVCGIPFERYFLKYAINHTR